MTRRTALRSAPLLLAAATLITACSELPSDAVSRNPATPRLTVTPTNAFTSIDGGTTHACGLTSGGQAWCWGRNAVGQLGDSSTTNSSVAIATHQSGVTFTQITAGDVHTCGITSAGQAWCWGYNADGRLGDSTTATLPLIPVSVHQNTIAFTSISAGNGHTCGLNSSGQAYCWGSNGNGQIGNNSQSFAKVPAAVQQGGSVYTQISSGFWQTCALDNAGQAYCWGYGGDGALGYGFTVGDSVPQAVTQSGVTFTTLASDWRHTCALDTGGQAYCWGLNTNAQLGDSTKTSRYTPVAARMPAGVSYAAIATGNTSTCAVSTTGQAYCWGQGTSGQLGNGSFTDKRLPVAVSQPAGVTFTSIKTEGSGYCALDTVGQTWCWGQNTYGQLGNNSTTISSSPVAVVH
ncbi:MAG TPA: hypothetical protein VFJ16_17165 [Longimicrobium sp.]|nr:hypothetical protein [Longimicrobium sp.]